MRGWPLVALALAACDQPAPQPAAPAGPANEAAPIAAPDAPTPEPSPPAAVEPAVRAFPAALRGRWGLGAEDCRPGSDIAKGLMTVTADRATFWEARATPGLPAADGAQAWTIDLAFEGEGQSWTTRTSFRLSDGGATLTRVDKGWENGTFRYQRCAA